MPVTHHSLYIKSPVQQFSFLYRNDPTPIDNCLLNNQNELQILWNLKDAMLGSHRCQSRRITIRNIMKNICFIGLLLYNRSCQENHDFSI